MAQLFAQFKDKRIFGATQEAILAEAKTTVTKTQINSMNVNQKGAAIMM